MKLYFICPDSNTAAGGIKQIYRQVDVLNRHGFSAYVLHESPFFKCTWFDNETKIVHSKQLFEDIRKLHKNYKGASFRKQIKQFAASVSNTPRNLKTEKSEKLNVEHNDIFVFPEVFAFAAINIYPEHKKVVYNQNCYYTFTNLSLRKKAELPYLHKNTLATIVASQDAIEYLKFAFKGINIHRIHYGMDDKIFEYTSEKKKKIAFMPRKLHEDVLQVIHIIREKEVFKDWEFCEIDKMNEKQVAHILKESAIFLSFNHREGFGMPPVEAMACGCIVIGYTGKGGKEYFKKEFSYPITDRDVQAYAKTLEEVMIAYNFDNTPFIKKGKNASDYVLSKYALKVEDDDIVTTWNSITKRV